MDQHGHGPTWLCDSPGADPWRRAGRGCGAPVAQSGELIRGRARIAEVESHFVGLRLGVGRRRALGDTVVVE
jgi:hypothetical protein